MGKYYLVKILTNTQGQDAPSIEAKADKNSALVSYHNTLAAFINADDVLYAVIMIMNDRGIVENLEVVDHRPAPEPAPKPEGE